MLIFTSMALVGGFRMVYQPNLEKDRLQVNRCACSFRLVHRPMFFMNILLSSIILWVLFWSLFVSLRKFKSRGGRSQPLVPNKTPLLTEYQIDISIGKRMKTIVRKEAHSSETWTTYHNNSAASESVITLPDTLRFWPWPRTINPHYATCKEESTAWCESFRAFSPSAQRAFNRCDFNLLASLAWPLLNKDGCRVGCDLMNLFFVIDEHTDVADGKTARIEANIVMEALRNPHLPRPAGEWVGGEVARQFWLNAIKTATPISQRRFIDCFQTYIDSVVQQAEDRVASHIRDVQSYFEVRRNTIGAKPSFAINEIHMNIPDEVIKHPIIVKLTELSIDMILIGNDLCSYNIEQAKGDDGHNLVRIVMEQYKTDTQTAMNCMGRLHDELAEQFMNVWRKIPTFGGPVDREIRVYADGLGNWVRGNDTWSFENADNIDRASGISGREASRSSELGKIDFFHDLVSML